jgi:hypothetical protein
MTGNYFNHAGMQTKMATETKKEGKREERETNRQDRDPKP